MHGLFLSCVGCVTGLTLLLCLAFYASDIACCGAALYKGALVKQLSLAGLFGAAGECRWL